MAYVTTDDDLAMGDVESDRRAILDPLVAEYRDRIAVFLAGRLSSAIDAGGLDRALKFGASSVDQERIQSSLAAVYVLRGKAEEAKAAFYAKAYKIVPKEPYSLTLSIPSEWAIKNTLDKLDAIIVTAQGILSKWDFYERNAKGFIKVAEKNYDDATNPELLPEWVKWSIGILIGVQVLQVFKR